MEKLICSSYYKRIWFSIYCT